MRRLNASLLALIIVLMPFMFPCLVVMATPGTVVAVDPTVTMVKVGQTFSVNVNITDVSGLVGWSFQLSYDTSILQLTDIEEGPFLKSAGPTFLINQTTSGQIYLGDCLFNSQGWTGASANGSGVLATATFKAIAVGESSLNLFSNNPCNAEIQLAADPQDPEIVVIPNTAISGTVTVSSDPDPPDPPIIAYALPSKTVVGQGYDLPMTLTATNPGDPTEIINVASYANTTKIENQTLTLPNGNSTNVSFLWNTLGFAYGNYTIGALATPASSETNSANATPAANGWVIVTIPGDLNGDFKVNLKDLVLLANAYGSKPGDSNWNPNTDVLENGVVGLADLVILTTHYGQQYP